MVTSLAVVLSLISTASPDGVEPFCKLVAEGVERARAEVAIEPMTQAACDRHLEGSAGALFATTEACLEGRCGKDAVALKSPTPGARAALGALGPEGSGRFWTLVYLARQAGRTSGTCWTATTHGFRYVARAADKPLPWKIELDGKQDGIVMWQTLQDQGAKSPAVPLLFPAVFRPGPKALTLDEQATTRLSDRVAAWYEAESKEKAGGLGKSDAHAIARALRTCIKRS